VRVASSTIAMSDVVAAKLSATKKIVPSSGPPSPSPAKILGSQTIAMPVPPLPLVRKTAVTLASGATTLSIAKTAGIVASAATRLAMLLPMPVKNASPTLCSRLLAPTESTSSRPQPAPVDQALWDSPSSHGSGVANALQSTRNM
jgi:hypothetical protein